MVFNNAAAPVSISEHLTDDTVIGALDKLPDYYRLVILPVNVYDFKYKEAAEILQIYLGTVMSRLNRARTELRKTPAGFAAQNGLVWVVFSAIKMNKSPNVRQELAGGLVQLCSVGFEQFRFPGITSPKYVYYQTAMFASRQKTLLFFCVPKIKKVSTLYI